MDVILFIAILIFSVVIHEYSHGWAADQLGDPTAKNLGRLTLNPIVHVDPIGSFLVPMFLILFNLPPFGWAKPVPYNPNNLKDQKRDPALVAVAGPLANLLMAAVFGLCIRIVLMLNIPSKGLLLTAFEAVVIINLILALFNLIPIPPLDGSKILFVMLPAGSHEFKVFLEKYGFYIVLLVIFIPGLFEGLILPIFNFLYRIIVPII